jgi:predicted Zn-dependent protease
MHFGKTKTEMHEEQQAKLIRQIEAETRKQASFIRRRDFEERMTAGKAYYDQKDYFNAFIKFSQGRDLVAGAYDLFSDAEKADANVWVDRTKGKMEEEELAEKVKLTQEAQESAVIAQSRAFVEEQHRKGMQLLQAGKYSEAIAEWQRGLERDPSNAKLKDLIAKTQGEQRSRTAELKRQAEAQASRGQIGEAIDSYSRLMSSGTVTAAEVVEYQAKIKQLQRQLNVEQLFRQGYNEYLSKNYCAAKGFFTQALEVEPNNSALRQHFNDADARCNARLTPLPESIRKRFVEATSLIESGNYEAALRILEDIQRHDRYNQRILDAIDLARERVKNKKKQP